MKHRRFTSLLAKFGIGIMVMMTSTAAFADSGQDNKSTPPQNVSNAKPTELNGLISTGDSDFVGLNSSLRGVVADMKLPTDAANSRLFNLDFTNAACTSGKAGCLNRAERLEAIYRKPITKSFDQLPDIELTPSASVNFNRDASSAIVGALVRIGDDLRDDSDFKTNTWYMFAGADAEAVTYAPNQPGILRTGNFNLQDRVLVGDAQAGVGYRMGDADITLGYFRREITSFGHEINMNSTSYTEDAAALSFTWRR